METYKVWTDGILALGTALTVAGIIGTVWAYFRKNIADQTIKLYKDNKEAQDARIATLESDHLEHQSKIITLESQVSALGKLQLDKIVGHIETILATQSQILDTQNKILEKFTQNPVTVNTTVSK